MALGQPCDIGVVFALGAEQGCTEDLLGDLQLNYDANAFPDAVHIAEQPLALNYAYAPGEEWDGVTVQLPAAPSHLTDARFDRVEPPRD